MRASHRYTPKHRTRTGKPLAGLAVAALAVAACAGVLATSNDPASGTVQPTEQAGWVQPYGGCKEAHDAPQSKGADDCRDHGWTINRRIVLNPHAVLRYLDMPHCRYEDGSGQHARCVWFGYLDGNQHGLTYWVGFNDTAHYFWPGSPVLYDITGAARWVDRELADALAEGGSPGADTRNWRQCVQIVGRTTLVQCPDQ